MTFLSHLKCGFLLFTILLTACTEPDKIASAASNVQVLPFQFAINGLDRTRTIRLYLPPNYDGVLKRYPVIYMHDGQNLFDDMTAKVSEWQVDESLNELSETKREEFIVVGIDSSEEFRMNELSPWQNKRFGKAEGEVYMDFIVEVVKPYIDTNFRTKPDRLNTAIIGSDMGGLISHYAIHEYPDVFSKAGIFSPAYWYSEDVFFSTQFKKARLDSRLYIVYGDNEGDGMISDTDRMHRQLKQQGHPRNNMVFKRVAEGRHNVQLWKAEFTEAVSWLFQQQPAF